MLLYGGSISTTTTVVVYQLYMVNAFTRYFCMMESQCGFATHNLTTTILCVNIPKDVHDRKMIATTGTIRYLIDIFAVFLSYFLQA